MKKLSVKLKVPYGYYHMGTEFDEVEFDIDDNVAETLKALQSEGRELNAQTLPQLATEHSELAGLHDMIIARGFDYLMNWKLSFGIEYAQRDEMLHFYIEEDTRAGLFTPTSKFTAEDEYIDWIHLQPYEFSCPKFDIDLTECENERKNITYVIE